MSRREKYPSYLKCPVCGSEGQSELREIDSFEIKFDSPVDVVSLSEGFYEVADKSAFGGVDIRCSTCKVSATKKR